MNTDKVDAESLRQHLQRENELRAQASTAIPPLKGPAVNPKITHVELTSSAEGMQLEVTVRRNAFPQDFPPRPHDFPPDLIQALAEWVTS